MTNPAMFICNCCQDIYAYENLTPIVLSTGSIRLCPDCLDAFHKKYGAIPSDCFTCECDHPNCPCHSMSANEVITRWKDKRHPDCPLQGGSDYDSRRIS